MNDEMHYIHSIKAVNNCVKIVDGLYYGGDFEEIKLLDKYEKLSESNIRFFSGFSVWNGNQFSKEKEFYRKIDKIEANTFFANDKLVSWEETYLNIFNEAEKNKGSSSINIEKIKLHVKKLLVNDKLEETIEFLTSNQNTFSSNHLDEIILISGRLSRSKKKQRLGIISIVDGDVERNNIVHSILEIINNLD